VQDILTALDSMKAVVLVEAIVKPYADSGWLTWRV
jgi:hypothetical protein